LRYKIDINAFFAARAKKIPYWANCIHSIEVKVAAQLMTCPQKQWANSSITTSNQKKHVIVSMLYVDNLTSSPKYM